MCDAAQGTTFPMQADREQCNNVRKSEGRGCLLRGIHIIIVAHDKHDMLPSTTVMKDSDGQCQGVEPKRGRSW